MDDVIFVRIVIPEEVVTLQNIKTWINELVLFSPNKMRTKLTEREFNVNQLHRDLENIFSKEFVGFQLDLRDETSSFTLSKGIRQLPSILCMYSKYVYAETPVNEIVGRFTDFFQRYDGVVGYMVSKEDQSWQNQTDISAFTAANKHLSGVRFKPDPFRKEREIIDTESFPGHNHFTSEGIWFGASWTMWFGNSYFSFVPKNKLTAFVDGYKNIELANGSISITLHENIWDFDNSVNRGLQWKFRKMVCMDEVAHQKLNKK